MANFVQRLDAVAQLFEAFRIGNGHGTVDAEAVLKKLKSSGLDAKELEAVVAEFKDEAESDVTSLRPAGRWADKKILLLRRD